MPESEYEAKFSLQHCVGISLMDGKNEFASYDPSSRDRAAELRKLISVRAGENYTAAYPKDWGGEVTVNLKGGGSVTAVRNACKGDPELPLLLDSCEYARSFHHLHPARVALLNVDAEHPDTYPGGLPEVMDAFAQFLSQVRTEGWIDAGPEAPAALAQLSLIHI